MEFIFTTLADNPYAVSKSLFRELASQRSARRGAYRIIFRVNDDKRLVEVLRVRISQPTLAGGLRRRRSWHGCAVAVNQARSQVWNCI